MRIVLALFGLLLAGSLTGCDSPASHRVEELSSVSSEDRPTPKLKAPLDLTRLIAHRPKIAPCAPGQTCRFPFDPVDTLQLTGVVLHAQHAWACVSSPIHQEMAWVTAGAHLGTQQWRVKRITLSHLELEEGEASRRLGFPEQSAASLPLCTRPNGPTFSVRFNHIPATAALSHLVAQGGRNLVLSPAVESKFTLTLCRVSFSQLLAILLQTHGLGQEVVAGALHIAPLRELTAQEHAQNELLHEEPLQFLRLALRYAKASELAVQLKPLLKGLLSEQAALSVDPRTNSLLIREKPALFDTIRSVVDQLDRAVPQVLIRVRIVNIDHDFERALGVTFRDASPPDPKNPLLQAIASAGGTDAFGMAIFRLTHPVTLDAALSALESQGKAEVLSRPQLVTDNQSTALIEAGEEIPYQHAASEGVTATAFKKAALKLEVTPQITPHHQIRLTLNLRQDKRSAKEVLGVPAIDTRHIQTRVLAREGETIVLGGIDESTRADGTLRVPFLSEFPLVGLLFKHHRQLHTRRELLIFVTPYIIKHEPVRTRPLLHR